MGPCDAGSGVLLSACLPVCQPLRSDALAPGRVCVCVPAVASRSSQMPHAGSFAIFPAHSPEQEKLGVLARPNELAYSLRGLGRTLLARHSSNRARLRAPRGAVIMQCCFFAV